MSSDWIEQGLVVGVQQGRFLYGEIGYHRTYKYELSHLPTFSASWSIGSEFSYFNELIVAPKIHGKLHLFFLYVGFNYIHYTNLSKAHALRIRPEVGFGSSFMNVNYGLNVGIKNEGTLSVNRHMIVLRLYIPVYKKLIGEYDKHGNKNPDF